MLTPRRRAGAGCGPRPAPAAAPTKSRNSGSGRSGRLLNSGCAWVPTKNGWSASSTNSTSRPSGEVPEQHQAALLERARYAVVELVAVPVPLVHDLLAVGRRATFEPGCSSRRSTRRAASCRPCRRRRAARPSGRSPGAGECGSNSLEFAPASPHDVAGELDAPHTAGRGTGRGTGSPLLAGVAGGGDLALDAADAEAAGDRRCRRGRAGGPRRAGPRRRRPRSSRSRPWRRTRSRRASAPRPPRGTRRAG